MDAQGHEESTDTVERTQHPVNPANPLISSTATRTHTAPLSAFETLPVELLHHITLEILRPRPHVYASPKAEWHRPRSDACSLAQIGSAFTKVVQALLYEKIIIGYDANASVVKLYLESEATKRGEFETKELALQGWGMRGLVPGMLQNMVATQTSALRKLELYGGEEFDSRTIANLSGLVSLKLKEVTVVDSGKVTTRMQLQTLELERSILPLPLIKAITSSSSPSLLKFTLSNWQNVEFDWKTKIPIFPSSVVLNFPHLTYLSMYDRGFDLHTTLSHCKNLQEAEFTRQARFTIAKIRSELSKLPSATLVKLSLDTSYIDDRELTAKGIDRILVLPSLKNLRQLTLYFTWEGAFGVLNNRKWLESWKSRGLEIELIEHQNPEEYL